MRDMLELMTLPFVACVILVGIHAYFGVHVLARQVIFVDLALAQIASLGATAALLFALDANSVGGYLFSVGFTALGAAVLALTRTREQKVSQEAIIGITYAVATAASILIADRFPHGGEHIKEMLTGILLWVDGRTVLLDAAVYGGVGLLHLFLFRTLWGISQDPVDAFDRGIRVRWWDFVFYLSFGVVVSLSVRVAGVLLVFCFLIIPAVISSLFHQEFRPRLLLGWGVGIFTSLLGLLFSWGMDTPSGPTVAVFFGLALLAAAALRGLQGRWVMGAAPPRLAHFRGVVALALALPTLTVVGLAARHQPEAFASEVAAGHGHSHPVPEMPAEADPSVALASSALRPLSDLWSPEEDRRQAALDYWRRHAEPEQVRILEKQLAVTADPSVRWTLIQTLWAWGDRPHALEALLELLSDDRLEALKAQQAAAEWLQAKFGGEIHYDPLASQPEKQAAIKRLRERGTR